MSEQPNVKNQSEGLLPTKGRKAREGPEREFFLASKASPIENTSLIKGKIVGIKT